MWILTCSGWQFGTILWGSYRTRFCNLGILKKFGNSCNFFRANPRRIHTRSSTSHFDRLLLFWNWGFTQTHTSTSLCSLELLKNPPNPLATHTRKLGRHVRRNIAARWNSQLFKSRWWVMSRRCLRGASVWETNNLSYSVFILRSLYLTIQYETRIYYNLICCLGTFLFFRS